jgi:DNA-binding winged helix-turn-helix (wHTH) protein
VHISNIRKKIERDAENPWRLVTVRGFGYEFVSLVAADGDHWSASPAASAVQTTSRTLRVSRRSSTSVTDEM